MTPDDFDWDCARAFLATLEEGTLTAAARVLGSSQPTIGRRIATLEEQLGATLFERVGTSLRPTPLARELGEHVRTMQAAAERMSLAAAGRSTELEGLVRISASEGVCVFLLPSIVAGLRRAYPGIRLELMATNDASDLARREADIAIRNFQPREPELVTRRLRDTRARLYGSPGYLDQLGGVADASDLIGADLLSFEPREEYLAGLQHLGLAITDAELTVSSSSHLSLWALARAGVGIATLMEEVGDADPLLVRVEGEGIPVFPVPMWLTCRQELRTTARYRVVFDALAAGLASS